MLSIIARLSGERNEKYACFSHFSLSCRYLSDTTCVVVIRALKTRSCNWVPLRDWKRRRENERICVGGVEGGSPQTDWLWTSASASPSTIYHVNKLVSGERKGKRGRRRRQTNEPFICMLKMKMSSKLLRSESEHEKSPDRNLRHRFFKLASWRQKNTKKATKAETSSLSSAAYHPSRSIVLLPLQMGFYHPQLFLLLFSSTLFDISDFRLIRCALLTELWLTW